MTAVTADPLLLLVAGLIIDALFGDMPAIFRYVPHPSSSPAARSHSSTANSTVKPAARHRAANAAS
jgi:hypothetical protein